MLKQLKSEIFLLKNDNYLLKIYISNIKHTSFKVNLFLIFF